MISTGTALALRRLLTLSEEGALLGEVTLEGVVLGALLGAVLGAAAMVPDGFLSSSALVNFTGDATEGVSVPVAGFFGKGLFGDVAGPGAGSGLALGAAFSFVVGETTS